MSNNLITLLEKLVAFPTSTTETAEHAACFNFVEDYLAPYGLTVRRHQSEDFPSLVATTRDTKQPKVLLLAHLDVVPAKPEQFVVQAKGGRLYGRGVYDMKFAAACYLQLVEDLKDELDQYDFGIMFTADEEIGGENGTGFLLMQGYGCGVGILPDGGNDWHLEAGHNGVWLVRLIANGRTAHGSRPWEGHNAILKLTAAIHEVRDLFGELNPDKSSLTVSQIVGGAAVNQVPDHAEATLDMRFINQDDYITYRQKIETVLREHGITFETLAQLDVGQTDLEHPAVVAFIETARAVLGRPLQTCHSLGASDAHYFAESKTPIIAIRPAGGDQHGPEEWVDTASLEQFYEVLKAYLRKQALAD
jgi:succinyl-diaminopimelate desuccinylase